MQGACVLQQRYSMRSVRTHRVTAILHDHDHRHHKHHTHANESVELQDTENDHEESETVSVGRCRIVAPVDPT